ncbi:hypothetical protein [Candidatus Methylocalor cossyra]|uniref:hypothetical protein n=1 Tax=Candidatus Methylocalor cossyra TaxID=3108543 RepID=UPI0032B25722
MRVASHKVRRQRARCGHIDKLNHPPPAKFRSLACGHSGEADVVRAIVSGASVQAPKEPLAA